MSAEVRVNGGPYQGPGRVLVTALAVATNGALSGVGVGVDQAQVVITAGDARTLAAGLVAIADEADRLNRMIR